MYAFRPALFDAPPPARLAALLTLIGLALLPWTLTLPDSVFGAWWVMSTWLPALVTVVLAPRETLATLRACRAHWSARGRSAEPASLSARRMLLPRAGAGAVRLRLRRAQGVRVKRQVAA